MLLLCLLLFPIISAQEEGYSFVSKEIRTPLDHFSFSKNNTFLLRYMVNDTFYKPNGPIFFYTGGNENLEVFAQDSGFIFEIAPQFDALIVFAEHRYYGDSLPFGLFSPPEYMGYLSSIQVLADFADLITFLQKTYATSGGKKLPVIAFGGAFGGNLAAWLKMKYPNSVTGAIASSAPIWMFKDQTPCDSFYKVVTQDFETLGSQKCRDTIQKSWKVIRTVTQNATGQIKLANLWNMCTYYQIDLKLVDWLAEVYTTLAEADSPYFTNFTVPLPANPIKEFCNVLDGLESDDDMDLVTTLGQALQIYTNYTGGSVCTIFQPTFEHLADNAWGFQKCTDMIRPVCSRDSDMFENFEFDFESYSEECFEKYEMRPLNEEVPILLYGGKELSTAKNIIFSNVLQDPWSAYGVLTNVTSDILALNIPNGARNTNLRASSENDSQELRDVRQIEVEYIEKWIATV